MTANRRGSGGRKPNTNRSIFDFPGLNQPNLVMPRPFAMLQLISFCIPSQPTPESRVIKIFSSYMNQPRENENIHSKPSAPLRTSSPANVSGSPASAAAEAIPGIIVFTTFAALIFLGPLDKGAGANTSVLLLFTLGIATYCFVQGRHMRELLFCAHIQETSWLQRFRLSHVLLYLTAALTALFLAVALLLFLLTTPSVVLLFLLIAQLFFLPLRAKILQWTETHLKEHSRQFLSNFLTVAIFGFLNCLILIAAKWIELKFFMDPVLLRDSHLMAAYVNDQVNFSPLEVQHLARSVLMFELEMRRLHSLTDGLAASIIFFYMLVPATMAAFAVPILLAGTNFLFRAIAGGSALRRSKICLERNGLTLLLIGVAVGTSLMEPSSVSAASKGSHAAGYPGGKLQNRAVGSQAGDLFSAWKEYRDLRTEFERLERECGEILEALNLLREEIRLEQENLRNLAAELERIQEAWAGLFQETQNPGRAIESSRRPPPPIQLAPLPKQVNEEKNLLIRELMQILRTLPRKIAALREEIHRLEATRARLIEERDLLLNELQRLRRESARLRAGIEVALQGWKQLYH